MVNSVNFSDKGQNSYRNSRICSKLGGSALALGTLMYLNAGKSDKFICNGHKLTKKLVGNTTIYKSGPLGKVLCATSIVGAAVAIGYGLGRFAFSLFDKCVNNKRAKETNS